MPPASLLFTTVCLVAVAGLVAAEWFRCRRARMAFKVAASSAFVAVACALPPLASSYDNLIIGALALSWVGDVCLLSERRSLFLAGLAAFLAAHVAFAAAFALGPLDGRWLVAALALLLVVGVLTLRWLWGALSALYRGAVTAYVSAIVAMCALAVASSAALGVWSAAVGATGFAASDLAVARERFVTSSRVNKMWGLPLYYLAQLLLAWSISYHGGIAG